MTKGSKGDRMMQNVLMELKRKR